MVVAALLLIIGCVISLAGAEEAISPTVTIAILAACAAVSPWLMSLAQAIANGLVGAVAGATAA